jgi:hypothetical protein
MDMENEELSETEIKIIDDDLQSECPLDSLSIGAYEDILFQKADLINDNTSS